MFLWSQSFVYSHRGHEPISRRCPSNLFGLQHFRWILCVRKKAISVLGSAHFLLGWVCVYLQLRKYLRNLIQSASVWRAEVFVLTSQGMSRIAKLFFSCHQSTHKQTQIGNRIHIHASWFTHAALKQLERSHTQVIGSSKYLQMCLKCPNGCLAWI